MRHDLTDTTFIIPIRLESQDRLRNIITSTCFLLDNFDTNVLIREVDATSVFTESALPQIYEFCDDISGLKHSFVKSDSPTFHRQKVLNEMIDECSTDIVVNYDCDVLLPIRSYCAAVDAIRELKADVVYPYGQGMFQRQVEADDELVSMFLSNDFNFDILDKSSRVHTSDFGWAQFFRRSVYVEGGMENENFVAYAPEDKERFYRFTTMGYNVSRVNDFVYHLEHSRGQNSWFNNPHMNGNNSEWEKIQKMDTKALFEYYKDQDYLKQYGQK